MNRRAIFSFLMVAAVGTGCALVIVGTYAVLRIPLPFSILLSCVLMTAAVAMIGVRARYARESGSAADAFSTSQKSGASFTSPAESRLLSLAHGTEHTDTPDTDSDESFTFTDSRTAIQLEAILLFELPRLAQEQETA